MKRDYSKVRLFLSHYSYDGTMLEIKRIMDMNTHRKSQLVENHLKFTFSNRTIYKILSIRFFDLELRLVMFNAKEIINKDLRELKGYYEQFLYMRATRAHSISLPDYIEWYNLIISNPKRTVVFLLDYHSRLNSNEFDTIVDCFQYLVGGPSQTKISMDTESYNYQTTFDKSISVDNFIWKNVPFGDTLIDLLLY